MKIFISYSHDSKEHKLWVKNLAQRLKDKNYEVILDQFDLKPGANISLFMEKSFKSADKVFIILTPNYKRKAEEREGGVGKEYSVISYELYEKNIKDDYKYIPLVIGDNLKDSTPFYLRDFFAQQLFIDLDQDNCFENFLQELGESDINKLKLEQNGSTNNSEKSNLGNITNGINSRKNKLSCEIVEFKSGGSAKIGGVFKYINFSLNIKVTNHYKDSISDIIVQFDDFEAFFEKEFDPKTKEIKSEIFILYPEQSEFIKLPELKINPINVRNFLNNKLKILIFSKIGKEEIVFDFSKISYQSNYEQVYLNEKDFNDY